MQVLLLAATGFAVAETLTSSQQQATAIESQGEFQSSQLLTQARLEDIQAESATTRGRAESDQEKIKTKKLIGAQRAKLAAQGIEVDSGSALDIQLETAELGAVDALTIRNNAFREATGHRIQAIDLRSQSGFTKLASKNKARNTITTGGLNAAREVTRGVGQALRT